MSEARYDPRQFGLSAEDLRAAADRLYAPDDGRLDVLAWDHEMQVRYGLVRSHLRGLADALDGGDVRALRRELGEEHQRLNHVMHGGGAP